jgi:hypothetical protein
LDFWYENTQSAIKYLQEKGIAHYKFDTTQDFDEVDSQVLSIQQFVRLPFVNPLYRAPYQM